jgi:guanylate kinase
MNHGKLIIITAPSGTGKTTLIQELKIRFPQLEESVSYTTRERRQDERNGQDYWYVDQKAFEEKKDAGEFLEWAEVHGNYYGTSKNQINEALKKGKSIVLDVDVQGAESILDLYPEASSIFIKPPSLGVLEERLRKRATESDDKIRLRLDSAKKEIEHAQHFKYQITNDSFEQALKELEEVLGEILFSKEGQ